MIVPLDVEDLVGTALGDLFEQPGEATFMYDTDGNLVSEDNFSNVLRAYSARRVLNAMWEDGSFEVTADVVSLHTKAVLAWM